MRQLDDVFGKIGFDALDPDILQRMGRPISSPSMDLARVTSFASASVQILVTICAASAASRAQWTCAPDAVALRSNSTR